MDRLEDLIQGIESIYVIAGDFNARAVEWGMPTTPDARGRYVLEMATRVGLAVVNMGAVSTFRRPGCAETIPDITLVSDTGWRVLEGYTGSDHQYITFTFRGDRYQSTGVSSRIAGWNVSKMDESVLKAVVEIGQMQL